MKLSKNFSLKEMTASQTAERKGINNNPNDDQITGLQKLCENICQKTKTYQKPNKNYEKTTPIS